jgi:hypothetical protein
MQNEPTQQRKLEQHQIAAFYVDCFAKDQVDHFKRVTGPVNLPDGSMVVDVGGGVGHFANELASRSALQVRVIDSDKASVDACLQLRNPRIQASIGDALSPEIVGDEYVVCFNLILHHLIGNGDPETGALQKRALSAWIGNCRYIFVHEYIYESLVMDLSGRIIFEITRSRFLSSVGKMIGKVIASFNANTFGVGVRFRSQKAWCRLFEECGLDVIQRINGERETVATPLRALLIREIRRDSFLLAMRQ